MRKIALLATIVVVAAKLKNERNTTIIECVEHEATHMFVR